MKIYRDLRFLCMGLLAFLSSAAAWAVQREFHALTIDDVLDTVTLERVAPSPDGEWIAAVVQRPARDGEVFGRTAYEVDPSRNDVWLISRRSGKSRNLTEGASAAAGFWCATWSPDGRKLAMLSTKPEKGEPRGGNNVRLYVWDTSNGEVRRLSDTPMMTQTRYGSPMTTLDVRGGAHSTSLAHTCRAYEENAPFAWLDDHRLLAVMLPRDKTSALLDQFGRPFDQAAMTRQVLREGREPTVTAMGSGDERTKFDGSSNAALLQILDLTANTATAVGTVPVYPFQGALTLDIAPDGRKAAVLAPVAVFPPTRAERVPYQDDAWSVEKRLGFVDLSGGAAVRWVTPPRAATYALELLGWSPDSTKMALRARASFVSTEASLFIGSADTLAISPIAAPLVVGEPAAGPFPHSLASHWVADSQLLVRGHISPSGREDWWLVEMNGPSSNLTANLTAAPATLRRTVDGRFVGIAERRIISIDPQMRKVDVHPGELLSESATIAWPDENGRTDSLLLSSSTPEGRQTLDLISLNGDGRRSKVVLPEMAELLDFDHRSILWRDPTSSGLHLRDTPIAGGPSRDLLTLNRHLANVDWGQLIEINYRAGDGTPLKGAVILPPGYRKGHRYPVITWVYSGFIVRNLHNYFTDVYMPGIYNLQLYAARGYVVLIPSMPFKRDAPKNDSYFGLTNGVLPAIDRLIELGIADPEKVGVMGQSFGGYSVYALITQTNRFKAAVAMAGVTDLAQSHMQFDPLARGYPGIEHERSVIWSIAEIGHGLGVPPYEDSELYRRNSPITYVDRVETPLLLVHGELDYRGSITQAETFFHSLYRQGKTARLLRYWGESHSLAQSPANIRNILAETLAWFSRYLSPISEIHGQGPPPSTDR